MRFSAERMASWIAAMRAFLPSLAASPFPLRVKAMALKGRAVRPKRCRNPRLHGTRGVPQTWCATKRAPQPARRGRRSPPRSETRFGRGPSPMGRLHPARPSTAETSFLAGFGTSKPVRFPETLVTTVGRSAPSSSCAKPRSSSPWTTWIPTPFLVEILLQGLPEPGPSVPVRDRKVGEHVPLCHVPQPEEAPPLSETDATARTTRTTLGRVRQAKRPYGCTKPFLLSVQVASGLLVVRRHPDPGLTAIGASEGLETAPGLDFSGVDPCQTRKV